MQGNVTVNNLNLAQGSFPEIERKALFVGLGSKNNGSILSINSQTDINDALGVNNSEIKRNVLAAMQNGGENWACFAAPDDSGAVTDTIIRAMDAGVSPELIVVCRPVIDAEEIEELQALAESIRTAMARRVIILVATPGIDPNPDSGQSWGDYVADQAALVEGISAYRVAAVPLLHGNDIGVLAGRLCNRAVSIADSPMRVATGPILGLGATPVDKNGVTLPTAVLGSLDAKRLSCIQKYIDYPGTYFGDCNLLDAPGGDYQVIEYLRPVDKAARAIRLLAIHRVANRALNSTPASIASNKTYFSRPLREMSKSVVFAGEHFPGDIKTPGDDAVTIVWPTKTSVDVYLKVQPYNSPKTITANIVLDLSNG